MHALFNCDTECLVTPGFPSGLAYNASYSVRWLGFIRPHVRGQVFTANVTVTGVDERVRLWVGSQLVIDQWSSLTSTHVASAVAFAEPTTGYHELRLEYKQEMGSSGAKLSWSGSPYSLARFEHIRDSPLMLSVDAGPVDLVRSSMYLSLIHI